MCAISAVIATFQYLLLLSLTSGVYSIIQPPCQSQLGLRHGVSDDILTFNVSVTSGRADHVRLNGPKAWRPTTVPGSLIQINISQPVLLTGLQIQGDPGLAGRVTGWLFEISLDCSSFKGENYTIDFDNPLRTQTVALKHPEFASCIRLYPRQYRGKIPAMRLELLGCAVIDSNYCHQDARPTKEIWMIGGGRQLNFDHEVVLSWIKVLLDLRVPGDTGDVGIFYSRSCEQWKYSEGFDMNIVSITSADEKSRWVTLELDTPVRARCVRVFPPLATKLKDIQIGLCGTRISSSLYESTVSADVFPSAAPLKDITDYLEDSPNVKDVQFIDRGAFISIAETPSKEEKEKQQPEIETVNKDRTAVKDNTIVTTECVTSQFTTSDTISTQTHTASTTKTSPATPATTSARKESDISTSGTTTVPEVIGPSTGNNIGDEMEDGVMTPDFLMSSTSNLTTFTDAAIINQHTLSSDDVYLPDENMTSSENETGMPMNLTDNCSNATNINSNLSEINFNSTNLPESPGDRRFSEKGNDTSDQSVTSNNISQSQEVSTMDNIQLDGMNETDLENNTMNAGPDWECGLKPQLEGIRRKRVINGHIDRPGEWPWLVSLHYYPDIAFTRDSGYKHLCGATLLSPEWVVTAAHCFSDVLSKGLSNSSNWRAFMGLHDQARDNPEDNGFVQERRIQAYTIPQGYDIMKDLVLKDLALVKLDKPVEITARVRPICLDDTDRYKSASRCYIAGWGKVAKKLPGSRFCHSAQLPILTNQDCIDRYNKLPDNHSAKQYIKIRPSLMCAGLGSEGEDACQGDSGGPMMCELGGRWSAVGVVVAGGYECAHKDTPGIYTRLSYYSDWIKNITQDRVQRDSEWSDVK